MAKATLILLAFISTVLFSGSETYFRNYHENGTVKSEGWKNMASKEGYWRFYHSNGKIRAKGAFQNNQKTGYWYFFNDTGKLDHEGHFALDQKVKWWLFYDKQGKVNHKCQLRNGIKDGYCLKYQKSKLTSAEKYSDGKKIKEWYDFSSFKKENNLSDLK
ncbi:MAG: hypothetical protein AAFQ20_01510 [Bacteroidota bacterium]